MFAGNHAVIVAVQLATDMACSSCSRRAVLKGIGIATVGVVVGCGQSGSDLPTAMMTTCGTGLCIDLGDPANAALATVGGAMLIDGLGDTIMVIRSSETAVIALSAICTHSGCSMNYDATQHVIDCPCHGSQFDQHGMVVQGPARASLTVYTATLANQQITVSS